MSITHAKVSAIADGPDAALVLPSDWNDDHAITTLDIVYNDNTYTRGLTIKNSNTGTAAICGRVPYWLVVGRLLSHWRFWILLQQLRGPFAARHDPFFCGNHIDKYRIRYGRRGRRRRGRG